MDRHAAPTVLGSKKRRTPADWEPTEFGVFLGRVHDASWSSLVSEAGLVIFEGADGRLLSAAALGGAQTFSWRLSSVSAASTRTVRP